MTRPAMPRWLACALAVTALVLSSLQVAAPASGADAEVTPLRVTIATLAPATIPQQGKVTLTGTVTNRSQRTWSDLNVYLLTSTFPMTTRAQLAAAAATPADTTVGSRRIAPGSYLAIGTLGPGQTVPYRLSVRRQDLGISGQPGVYWVGVHVLGDPGNGRDAIADGRARTFMPLLPRPRSAAGQRTRTRLALVIPLKSPVRRGPVGRLANIDGWRRTLSPDGRLDRLLRLSSGTTAPFTWAIDPAVLDAAQSVARRNPPLRLGPAPGERAGSGSQTPSAVPSSDPSTTPSPSATSSPSSPSSTGSASGSGSGSASPSASGSKQPGQSAGSNNNGDSRSRLSDYALSARIWLAEFRRQVHTHSVAALPYADMDVAAVLSQPHGSGLAALYRQAVGLSRSTLAGYGVDQPTKLVAPHRGYLPAMALHRIAVDTPVLLSQAALPTAPGSVVATPGQAPVVLDDATAGNGGPAPNSQFAALPVRQRLLSDAALHALSSQRDQPLVVSMPQYWNPGDAWASSDFFGGLTQPWLQLVDLQSVVNTASTAPPDSTANLVYPRFDRAAQLPAANLMVTHDVAHTGQVFDRVLTDNNTIDDNVARIAMLASSYNTRAHPALVRHQAARTGAYLRRLMAHVQVIGPQFVMMSGESGPIQVTLVNGLEETVTVGLRASTPSSDLHIEKVDPVTLGPGRRTSIRLQANAHDLGVHSVTLETTDSAGEPLGSTAHFSVRTSNVSTVIWVIIAIGGGLLFLAIVIRLYRRVRRRKRTHGPLLPREPSDRSGQELKA